ncbi:diguanylate cyclase domain-containing protein [Sulfoacidibacillus ferrooxidans]|uniref:GGDEF domain-containing protein n=1 Tax=Sulfoacidibacillus ferrooxidans TaxID=2005001 RepID=A0A9X1VA66_9BACL|nr:diguanylate cyclase [Sulfoacidibacillus ferrooxidans]MCI0184516.1 hypothetical protein [Sulfoacidibacillus ferrooxidans]
MRRLYVRTLLILNGLAILLFVYLSHVFWDFTIQTTQQRLLVQAEATSVLLDHRWHRNQQIIEQAAKRLAGTFSPSSTKHVLDQLQHALETERMETLAVMTTTGHDLVSVGPHISVDHIVFQHTFFISPPFSSKQHRGSLVVLEGTPIDDSDHLYLGMIQPVGLFQISRLVPTPLYTGIHIRIIQAEAIRQPSSLLFPTPSTMSDPNSWLAQVIQHTSNTSFGVLTHTMGAHGNYCIIGYDKLQHYPFYIVSSLPVNTVFWTWIHSMFIGIVGFLMLVIFSDLAIFFFLFKLDASHNRKKSTLQLYEILSTVTHITSTAEDETTCLQTLVIALCACFYAASIGQVDGERVTILFSAGPGADQLQKLSFDLSNEFSQNAPLAVRAIKAKQISYDNHLQRVDKQQDYGMMIEEYSYASELSIPLIRQQQVWGVLNLISDRSGVFDRTVLPLANQIGHVLQDALERFDLREAQAIHDQKNDIHLAFHDVIGVIAQASQDHLSEDQLLQLVCDTFIRRHVFTGVEIGMPLSDGMFQFPYYAGIGIDDASNHLEIRVDHGPLSQGPASRAWQSGRYLVENDGETSVAMISSRQRTDERNQWNASAYFIINREKEKYALLGLYHQDKAIFDEEFIQLGIRLVELIGQILTNQEREAELIRLHHFYEALAKANELIIHMNDSQTLFHQLGELIMCRTEALGCYIGFEKDHHLDIKSRLFTNAELEILFDQSIAQFLYGFPGAPPTVVGDVLLTHQPVVVNRYSETTRYPGKEGYPFMSQSELDSIAAFPIYGSDQVGVLTVLGTTDLFSSEIITLLQSLANNITDKLRQLHTEQERNSAQSELAYQAFHDALTRIPNRAYLERMIDHILVKQSQSPYPLTLIIADLDGFKQINDTYGHRAGDVVLQVVAMRLKECLRSDDRIFRYGGDEFIILVEELLPLAAMERICKQTLQRIQEPILWDGNSLTVGISIGIAQDSSGTQSPRSLFKEADEALFMAKKAGKNTYVIR